MTIYSKLNKSFRCFDIIHPTDCKCTNTIYKILKQPCLGCFVVVIPWCLIPFIMNIKNINKTVIKNTFLQFTKLSGFVFVTSRLFIPIICLLSNTIGLSHSNVIFVPAFTAVLISTLFLNSTNRNLVAKGLSIINLDVILNYSNYFPMKILRKSKVLITLTFMLVNAIIVQLISDKKMSTIWIFPPTMETLKYPLDSSNTETLIEERNAAPCYHKDSCNSYIIKGCITYLKYGVGLEILRKIISNYSLVKEKPLTFLLTLPKLIKFKFIGFLTGYIGVYRFLNCLINRKLDKNLLYKQFISSFLAGISYYLYPNTTILSHGIITLIEMLYKMFMLKKTNGIIEHQTKPKLLIADHLLNRIISSFCIAKFMQMLTYKPWMAPKLMHDIVYYTIGNIYPDIHKRIITQLFGTSSTDTLYLFGLN